MITQNRGINPDESTRNRWKLIWNSELHGRHSLLLWKLLNGALPTLDKISKYVHNVDTICYLCKDQEETLHHLCLTCPITKLLWWNSPWQVRIEAFHHLTVVGWIWLIMGKDIPFPVEEREQRCIRQFFAVSFEQIWFLRNRSWQGGTLPDWRQFSKTVNSMASRYWKASCAK